MTTLTIYAILAIGTFMHYHHEPVKTRIALGLTAPILLWVLAVAWVVTRLEELG